MCVQYLLSKQSIMPISQQCEINIPLYAQKAMYGIVSIIYGT